MPDQYATPADAPSHERKDAIRANGLLVNLPGDCMAAFEAARAAVVDLELKASELVGRGYNAQALIDQMRKPTAAALKAMTPHALRVRKAFDAVSKARRDAAQTFPDTQEGEVAQALVDGRIADRVGTLKPEDLAPLQAGEIGPRLDDPRIVQALTRLPLAAHDVDAEQMELIVCAYARRYQPRTDGAAEAVSACIAAARAVLASLLLCCSRLSGQPLNFVVTLIEHGVWLMDDAEAAAYAEDDVAAVKAFKVQRRTVTVADLSLA